MNPLPANLIKISNHPLPLESHNASFSAEFSENMAVATKDRRFTRSRQKTVPDGPTEKPEPRSLRLRKGATADLGKTGNCTVVISKLELENTKEDAKRRKRTRVDIEDRNEVEKETKAKVINCYLFFKLLMSTKLTCKRVAIIIYLSVPNFDSV